MAGPMALALPHGLLDDWGRLCPARILGESSMNVPQGGPLRGPFPAELGGPASHSSPLTSCVLKPKQRSCHAGHSVLSGFAGGTVSSPDTLEGALMGWQVPFLEAPHLSGHSACSRVTLASVVFIIMGLFMRTRVSGLLSLSRAAC